MKPIERAKVSLHEKSSIDDDFAPVETDSTIKVPGAAFNRSPIEVRVFGLPHNRSDAARAKLKRIFDNINKRGKKFDNGDEGYIEIGHFDIHEGEPDLQTSNTNKFQSTAKINFSPLGKLHVTKKLEAMDAVRMALIELKAEGFRSCGKDLDRRAQGDFVFSKPAGVERDDLKETKASAWVRRMCQDMGHLVLRDWGRFDYTKENSYVHERHVRFLHPASEQFIDEKHQTWVFEGYDVHFVPTQDVLIPTNPCSIAIHGAGGWSKDDIEEELSTGLRISMLKKAPRRHFSTTAIMSTRNGSWLLRRTSASQSTSVNRCQSISHPGNSCTTSTPKQRRSIKLWLQRIVGGTDGSNRPREGTLVRSRWEPR
jgi:hypothetical protein